MHGKKKKSHKHAHKCCKKLNEYPKFTLMSLILSRFPESLVIARCHKTKTSTTLQLSINFSSQTQVLLNTTTV